MFLLNLLPDWFYHALLILSLLAIAASYLLKFIPFVSTYRIPLKIGGVVLLLFSVWAEGGIVNEAKWQARVKELEAKVAQAEAQAKETNTKIQEKIVYKDKVVREKGQSIIQYVDREVVKKEEIIKYIEQCPVPKDIIDAHNAAATLNKAAEGNKK